MTTIAPPVYAGVGRRVGALAIDNATFFVAYLTALLVTAVISQVSAGLAGILLVLILLGGGLAGSVYVLYRLAVRGDSIGKRALGLQVVGRQDGLPIGWGRAFLRQLVIGVIGAFTFGIGLLVLAAVANNHPRKQGWHDLAVDSIVIDRNANPVRTAVPSAPPTVSFPSVSFPIPAEAAPVGNVLPPAQAAHPPAPVSYAPSPAQTAMVPAQPSPVAPVSYSPSTATALISAVPGMGSPVPEVASAPVVELEPMDEIEHTRMVTRTGGWALRLPDGRELMLTGNGLVGRAPVAREGETVQHLVALADEERSVSKTHLAFGLDAGSLWVEDRGSTNGSALLLADGTERPCEPGVRTAVPAGAAVRVGQERLDLLRR